MSDPRTNPDPLWTEPTESERRVMDTWRRAIEEEELAHHSHLGAIVIVAAVVGLSVIAAALLLGMGR